MNLALKNKNQLVGYNGTKDSPNSLLLKNNNLHVDIIIDATSKIGSTDKANICDEFEMVWLEYWVCHLTFDHD